MVEFLPQLVPQLGLTLGVGFDVRMVSSGLSLPPSHTELPSFAGSAPLDPGAPPSLALGFAVPGVFTTTRDSDYSNSLRELGGFATLPGALRR